MSAKWAGRNDRDGIEGHLHMTSVERRVITPPPAMSPDIGRWLWALEDARARTKREVDGLSRAELDWTHPDVGNAIGSLLYHIALIEADYLCIDMLGREDYLDDLQPLFPFPDRDDAGRLTAVTGVPLTEHLARLDTVRARLLGIVAGMTDEQMAHVRQLPEWDYEISPAWTLHHLMQHEAQHRGEIGVLRLLFKGSAAAATP
jgi:uncharacterized damage-inducible protein DinB